MGWSILDRLKLIIFRPALVIKFHPALTTQVPNLGKTGYVTTIEDFLPGSTKIPQKVYIPKPKRQDPEKYAWEEEDI
jgi:hypothetical protein